MASDRVPTVTTCLTLSIEMECDSDHFVVCGRRNKSFNSTDSFHNPKPWKPEKLSRTSEACRDEPKQIRTGFLLLPTSKACFATSPKLTGSDPEAVAEAISPISLRSLLCYYKPWLPLQSSTSGAHKLPTWIRDTTCVRTSVPPQHDKL